MPTWEEAKKQLGLSCVSKKLHIPCDVESEEDQADEVPWTPEVDAAEAARAALRAATSIDIHARLQYLRGNLCLFPLDFLKAETLAPSTLSKLVVGPRLYQ